MEPTTVLHVENNEHTRGALARLLDVDVNNRLGKYDYVSTGVVAGVQAKLKADAVRLLILDLGLNVSWDNRHMIRVLRHLALGEDVAESQGPRTCEAHGLALLAHQHKVPLVVLTNYVDYLGGDPPLTETGLADVFCAKAIFRKNDAGIRECAAWIKGKLGLT